MKSIQDLAREAWLIEFIPESDIPKLLRFHDAAIAQYRESLLAGVGEAVNVPACTLGACKNKRDVCDPAQHCMNTASYYTADQMAAAVLRERIKTLESVVELSTVGATYPELMKYLQAEIEAIRNTK